MCQEPLKDNNKELFNDYYLNNNGTLFKTFDININNNHLIFDVYWGDSNIIFHKLAFIPYPLAFTIFPKRKNDPNTRIYLHEKVNKEFATAFEFILAHEIGHFCLFDIFGINHWNEHKTETWADFFAYKYFMKYRNINDIEQFKNILIEVDNLQNNIYNISTDICNEYSYTNKTKDLQLLKDEIQIYCNNGKQDIFIMLDTFKNVLVQIQELI